MPDIDAQRFALGLTTYFVLLFSLSVHESAHAWTALRMGDDTAASLGRITLNPIAHIDILGTVIFPLVSIFVGGLPFFGWAKPTPTSPRRFTDLRRGQILVAGAGPVSNLLLALVFAALFVIVVQVPLPQAPGDTLRSFLEVGIVLNVVLAVFNLVPLPPLDGSHIASWTLPRGLAERYDEVMGMVGGWALLILALSGVLGWFINPIILFVHDAIRMLVGLR
jgi:Zn-dependent protease